LRGTPLFGGLGAKNMIWFCVLIWFGIWIIENGEMDERMLEGTVEEAVHLFLELSLEEQKGVIGRLRVLEGGLKGRKLVRLKRERAK
jgi:hypothetical protein